MRRPLERASQAQQTRARLVFSVIDTARQATTMGLAMLAFRVCGLFPYGSAPGSGAGTFEPGRKTWGGGSTRCVQVVCRQAGRFSHQDEFMATLRSHGPVGTNPDAEVPVEGGFLNDAEPEISARYASSRRKVRTSPSCEWSRALRARGSICIRLLEEMRGAPAHDSLASPREVPPPIASRSCATHGPSTPSQEAGRRITLRPFHHPKDDPSIVSPAEGGIQITPWAEGRPSTDALSAPDQPAGEEFERMSIGAWHVDEEVHPESSWVSTRPTEDALSHATSLPSSTLYAK
jgi:hypothetical protein